MVSRRRFEHTPGCDLDEKGWGSIFSPFHKILIRVRDGQSDQLDTSVRRQELKTEPRFDPHFFKAETLSLPGTQACTRIYGGWTLNHLALSAIKVGHIQR